MNKKHSVILFLLSSAAFILCFLIGGRFYKRFDLTQNKIFTISDVTKKICREIPDLVTITYFISDKLALAHPMPAVITDLIGEYAAYSEGKINFITRDPAKEDLINAVEEIGIIPNQIQISEQNETTLATVYSGILIEYLDRKSVIPLVFSVDTLEYDISSRIRLLARGTENMLGVIVADSYKQWQDDYAILSSGLYFSDFRVREIIPGEIIPETLPAVFVLGGTEYLDEGSLRVIDDYIGKGGNVLFAADSIVVDAMGNFEAGAAKDGGLLAMLANYGAVLRRALVLDRAALNLTFQTQGAGGGTEIQSVKYPEWLSVPEQNGNLSHPLTARFGGVDLYWASPVELYPPAGIDAEILFSSTDEAWLQTEEFITDPKIVSQFENEISQTGGTKILGASLYGIFPPAFGGPPAEALQRKAAKIIVVGDADFAGSLMGASGSEGRNLDFLVKAAVWLSGDDDILSIRGKNISPGRLDRITDVEEKNAAMTFSKNFNTFFIPLCVIIAGFFMCAKKEKNKSRGRKAQNGI